MEDGEVPRNSKDMVVVAEAMLAHMVKLDFGVPNDKAEWDKCTAVADCPEPKLNAYPVSEVLTTVTKQFAEKSSVSLDYFKARKWDNKTVGKVLAWMDENQGTTRMARNIFSEITVTYG